MTPQRARRTRQATLAGTAEGAKSRPRTANNHTAKDAKGAKDCTCVDGSRRRCLLIEPGMPTLRHWAYERRLDLSRDADSAPLGLRAAPRSIPGCRLCAFCLTRSFEPREARLPLRPSRPLRSLLFSGLHARSSPHRAPAARTSFAPSAVRERARDGDMWEPRRRRGERRGCSSGTKPRSPRVDPRAA